MIVNQTQELARINLQNKLDATKTQAEKNQLGQFATPTELAKDILQYCIKLLPKHKIRFLDPAFGTGAFYSALLNLFPISEIDEAIGYEIDSHCGQEARQLWSQTILKLNIADFTACSPPEFDGAKANLIICNPPYIRHHHLTKDEKLRLQNLTEKITGIKLSKLAGTYCYFLLISHGWMAKNCLAAWLIPSGFMDVNYGQQIRDYLLTQVTLLRVHSFEPKDMQFKNALVSSSVVWFRNKIPSDNHQVEFTYSDSLTKPKKYQLISVKALKNVNKWTNISKLDSNINIDSQGVKLSELFTIKRGLATGANDFFILTPEQISKYQLPPEFLTPILPSPRYFSVDEIEADALGNPILERQLFLLSCDLSKNEIQFQYPSLWQYLQMGIKKGISNRYLCKHRRLWYQQEYRKSSALVCTYMGRKNDLKKTPFRFILNHSQATATNVYLILYPKFELENIFKKKPDILRKVWQILNQISLDILISKGRVYGGGLHKLEPRELGNVPADKIIEIIPSFKS
ncbi:MAG: N-6 DNA methylase [Okeania sp. SIO1I7]|nr:N-6 DNA methylase [Okeania sp. SIO1I7]